ncbi:hypothetical protein Cni_G13869 [Canna indica]|uniref:Uncharacterized protein n=1 Tax=Canna indica TaxID=4628 RepID=A0AAQ3QBV6_9LILI|nr:hypothetical protein Cni_G13869 [Canna indica]
MRVLDFAEGDEGARLLEPRVWVNDIVITSVGMVFQVVPESYYEFVVYANVDYIKIWIKSIDFLETFRGVERKGITLVDSDGIRLKFVLWGEQAHLA